MIDRESRASLPVEHYARPADARQLMLAGVDALANVVKVRLGRRGRNVLSQNSDGAPTITKDGVTVEEGRAFRPLREYGRNLSDSTPPQCKCASVSLRGATAPHCRQRHPGRRRSELKRTRAGVDCNSSSGATLSGTHPACRHTMSDSRDRLERKKKPKAEATSAGHAVPRTDLSPATQRSCRALAVEAQDSWNNRRDAASVHPPCGFTSATRAVGK